MIFAGGCEDLDSTMSVFVRRHGGDVVGLQQDADKASRAYDRDRDGF